MMSARKGGLLAAAALFGFLFQTAARAQDWDYPAEFGKWVSDQTQHKLKISAEIRGRYESRTGTNFGSAPDVATAIYRNRFSMSFQPSKWVKFSGMVQDSRSPGYGLNAPSSVRDPADLMEGYMEILPGQKKGFGMTVGRMMLNYGDARLVGSPQWGNVSRSWDHARAYFTAGNARMEVLFLSPVKVRTGEFNRPVLGDRIWGTYNTFTKVGGKHTVDAYVLRHDQNRPGGFTSGNRLAGTDRLGVTDYGARVTGPAALGMKYTLEADLQTGKVGPATHRAGAWVSTIARRFKAGNKPLDLSGEYKFASGTGDPSRTNRVSTFDQMYPSGHDKFGHQDLFGWRNIHNVHSVTTLGVTSKFALNFMYNSFWLASARDGLYDGSGKSIVRSAQGTAGRHVGQEADVFATYKYGHFQVGAGYGYLFKGQFVKNTTPGVSPSYVYIFHTYSL